jgi:hypothetical protein
LDFFSQFSLCTIVTGVIENGKENNFSLYPNPTNGPIYLHSKENITHIILFDMIGQQRFLKTINDGNIDMSHLSSGMYLLWIEFSNGKTKTIKVKKE